MVAEEYKDFVSKNQNNYNKKTIAVLKPSVHLGGKAYIKKLIK